MISAKLIELIEIHANSLTKDVAQDLNTRVGEFFDEALYYLTRGSEAEARLSGASKAH